MQWPMVVMLVFKSGGRRFDAHHCYCFLGQGTLLPLLPSAVQTVMQQFCCAEYLLIACMSYQGTAEKQYFYTDAVFPSN